MKRRRWHFPEKVGTINYRTLLKKRRNTVTLRKWFHLFWTTLLIGMVLGIAAGLILQLLDQDYSRIGLPGYGFNIVNMALGGATISILSQMGYFAYLIVRYIGIGMIRKKSVFDLLQWAIIIVVLGDLIILRYMNFNGSIWNYVWLPLIIAAISWVIAAYKVRLTNPNGFLPTFFYMSIVTVLEAVPALRQNSAVSTFFMLVPLMACNAWQILILPRILGNEKSRPQPTP
jgi:KinB signaling pathway activation protein